MKPEDERNKHTLLLGGVGGDSHSVGLNILRRSLSTEFDVIYIGIQNQIQDFFVYAPFVNLVLISCMDGHAKRYMKAFPELMLQHKVKDTIWYLGGNISVGNILNLDRYFMEMGLSRVFTNFIDVKSVVELARRDLSTVKVMQPNREFIDRLAEKEIPTLYQLEDEQKSIEQFEELRPDILAQWKTGTEARNIEENAVFLKSQPNWVEMQQKTNLKQSGIIVQPRCGVSLVEHQIKLFKAYHASGALALSYQVDSLTRNNNYAEAEEEIRASNEFHMELNGFPIVNHGVHSLRRIISETKIPLQTRHSTRKPELLAEISYAGGVTAYEGGAISYNIPYYKNYSLNEAIWRWQYVDRLTGLYYQKYGIKIDREFFGTLTATLIPPSLAIATGLFETILAVTQGVISVSLGYAEQGNRIQDIAAIRAMKKITENYLNNLGYSNVQVNTVFHQYMAAFPRSQEKSEELIYQSAITAGLTGCTTRILTKTPVESFKIPSLKDNIEGLHLVQKGILKSRELNLEEYQTEIEEEEMLIEKEVDDILESIISCGKGSFTEGIVTGFRNGLIDIPFSPSVYNKGDVATIRDKKGAIRFLSFGNMSFRKEIKEYHNEKVDERLSSEGVVRNKNDYLLIEHDVMQVARSQYDRWPLYGDL